MGAWYNPHTGVYGRGYGAYGPYGGVGMGASYNPRTGTYARGATAYGPYGSRSAAQAYNPRTGTYAQTRQGSNVYGNWGTSSVQRGDNWAQTAHRENYRTGTRTSGIRTDSGAGAVPAPVPAAGRRSAAPAGGDVYAGHDGNVYRRSDGGGWEQSNGSGGWTPTEGGARDRAGTQPASRPATGTTQAGQLDRDRNARVQGNQRATDRSGWQSSGGTRSGAGSYRGGGGMRGGGMRGGGGRRRLGARSARFGRTPTDVRDDVGSGLPGVLIESPHGLYCVDGRFHVDPWDAVPRAVITHAHGDHARRGSAAYLCSETCAPLLARRFGDEAPIETLAYGQRLRIGEVTVSLHPAGHVLGSSQVRIEGRGGVWVVSGDYKRAADPTCTAFEPVRLRGLSSRAVRATDLPWDPTACRGRRPGGGGAPTPAKAWRRSSSAPPSARPSACSPR